VIIVYASTHSDRLDNCDHTSTTCMYFISSTQGPGHFRDTQPCFRRTLMASSTSRAGCVPRIENRSLQKANHSGRSRFTNGSSLNPCHMNISISWMGHLRHYIRSCRSTIVHRMICINLFRDKYCGNCDVKLWATSFFRPCA